MSLNQEFNLHPQLEKDAYQLGDFPLSRLLLINDCQYPWFVLVPRKAQIREIYQLEQTDQVKLWQESALLSQALMSEYAGDKLNVANIGNMVPQLHMHHIVRFKNDKSWPAPVWGKLPMLAYEFEKVLQIKEKLAPKLSNFQALAIEKK